MTNVTVIGTGNMGQYTARALQDNAHVKVYSFTSSKDVLEDRFKNDFVEVSQSVKNAVHGADFVVFCVPTENVHETMMNTLGYCKKGAVISGQTSRKTPEAEAFDMYMREYPHLSLEMVTIHTMCNPRRSDASKEILGIINHGASIRAYGAAMELYSPMSENVVEFKDVDDHDSTTANTQINTSRTMLSIASAFAKVGCFPWKDLSYSTAFDVMKFSLAARAANLPGHVYKGIQFGSKHGKDIVSKAIKVENDLFGMIVGDNKAAYEQRVMTARKKIFGDYRQSILSDEIIQMFGELTSTQPNSHFSIIQYAVAMAEIGRNPFKDLRAATPMYTSLLCMTDWLFNNEIALEEAINAPFDMPQLRIDDLGFHDEINGWSDALLLDNDNGYDNRHKLMTERIDVVNGEAEAKAKQSETIVKVCRESMKVAMDSGLVSVS